MIWGVFRRFRWRPVPFFLQLQFSEPLVTDRFKSASHLSRNQMGHNGRLRLAFKRNLGEYRETALKHGELRWQQSQKSNGLIPLGTQCGAAPKLARGANTAMPRLSQNALEEFLDIHMNGDLIFASCQKNCLNLSHGVRLAWSSLIP